MATVNPPLGVVALGSHLGAFATDPDALIVGGPPQWSDDSDATYAYLTRQGSDGGSAYARTDPIASVTGCTVTVRAKSVATGTPAEMAVFAGRTADATFSPLFRIPIDFPADGTIHEVTGSIDFGPELTEITDPTWATDGFHIEFGNGDDRQTYVYQVDVTLTLATTTVPVTRLHPRKDSHGPMGSAPRLVGEWPPERIIRY